MSLSLRSSIGYHVAAGHNGGALNRLAFDLSAYRQSRADRCLTDPAPPPTCPPLLPNTRCTRYADAIEAEAKENFAQICRGFAEVIG